PFAAGLQSFALLGATLLERHLEQRLPEPAGPGEVVRRELDQVDRHRATITPAGKPTVSRATGERKRTPSRRRSKTKTRASRAASSSRSARTGTSSSGGLSLAS